MAAATHVEEREWVRRSGDGSLAWLGLLLLGTSGLLSLSFAVWLVRMVGRLVIP